MATGEARVQKPKVTIDAKHKDGEYSRTITRDVTGLNPSAIAKEAGIGVEVDADGLPVDRYRAAGIEEEIPGWENTKAQRLRLIRYIARRWLLEELHYRDRMEFGVIPGSRSAVPNVPRVLVQAVSCGLRHTICITSKGVRVMAWRGSTAKSHCVSFTSTVPCAAP